MKYYYNQQNYEKLAYNKPNGGKATIKSGGCGVCAACIVFNNLAGKELYTVAKMRDFSISNKARTNSGTDMNTLLKALCKANTAFSFITTSDVDKLTLHLKSGGMAIANQGSSYNVFSTAGHYVVAYKPNGSNIEVVDPQMYSGKYDAYNRPKRIVKKTTNGCIVSKAEIKKATADRNPSYYLVTYKKPTTTKPTETSKSVSAPALSFKTGAYTLTADLNVRTGAGTKYDKKKYTALTKDGQKNAVISAKPYAVLKKGTKVTVSEVKKVSATEFWGKIPSGWICLSIKSGTVQKTYVK